MTTVKKTGNDIIVTKTINGSTFTNTLWLLERGERDKHEDTPLYRHMRDDGSQYYAQGQGWQGLFTEKVLERYYVHPAYFYDTWAVNILALGKAAFGDDWGEGHENVRLLQTR